jgi:hypothetical protein
LGRIDIAVVIRQNGPQDPNGPAAQEMQETIASVIREKVDESMGPGEELSMIDEARRGAVDDR